MRYFIIGTLCAASACSGLPEEGVTFASGDFTLAGTLTVPSHEEGQRLPAVVLTHGSGVNGRNETISGQLGMDFGFDFGVFADLAEGFHDKGYITLRYDKRNCGFFEGCNNSYSVTPATNVDDYLADALAGIDFLAARDDVSDVFYVGHSEGGQFAPEVLVSRPNVRAAISLAGPFRPIDAIIADQVSFMRALLEEQNAPPEEIEKEIAPLESGLADLAAARAGTFSGDAILDDAASAWQAWMALGDRMPAALSTLDRPVLQLSGDYDLNIPGTESARWARAFSEIGDDPGHEQILLPCITHVLNCVQERDLSKLTQEDFGRNVDASVIDAAVGFLNKHRS